MPRENKAHKSNFIIDLRFENNFHKKIIKSFVKSNRCVFAKVFEFF